MLVIAKKGKFLSADLLSSCVRNEAFCLRSWTLIIFHFIYQHITTLQQLSISQAVLSRLQKYKNKIYFTVERLIEKNIFDRMLPSPHRRLSFRRADNKQ